MAKSQTDVAQTPKPPADANTPKEYFPPITDGPRLEDYLYFEQLYDGDHYEAFNYKIDDPNYTKAYKKLRYVMANFAGLVSRIMADMLFIEPISIKVDDPALQSWLEDLMDENNMNIQLYESQLTASSKGDTLFKLRGGPRHPEEEDDESTVIIEEVTPAIYFPEINSWNVKADPQKKVLAWKFKSGTKEYVRKEIHTYGKIENKVFELKGTEIIKEVGLSILGDGNTIQPLEELKIDECLLFHIPNPKPGNKYFGYSDYKELTSLFYAINNRLTKTDNILDKHSDPILALPEGILDEKGEVKKSKLGLIEMPDDSQNKPEYIVWNANLDSAFKEIDKLVEMLFMVSETSPDILGMGQGQSDSGRALKLKLLRTIAKVRRKRLYYDKAIKDMLYTAQLLAQAYDFKVNGNSLPGKPQKVEIIWQDGLPVDELEQVTIETQRLDAGITSKKDAIMRIEDLDEKSAEKKVKEIAKEDLQNAPPAPAMNFGKNPINPNQPPKPGEPQPPAPQPNPPKPPNSK